MSGKINDNIRSIRELKNYSQEYMALRLNVTQAGYSKIEKGNSSISLDKLEEIASIFEMDLNSIIQFESSLYLGGGFQKLTASMQQDSLLNIERLYRDKIALLEKLLDKVDRELKNYKDKYGSL